MQQLKRFKVPTTVAERKWLARGLRQWGAMAPHESNLQRVAALKERVFTFVCAVIRLCPHWRLMAIPDQTVWRQLTRAALSVALNLEEADSASSRADFVARIRIVLRESKECVLCLRVIEACHLAGHEQVSGLRDEASQLAAIFGAITRNAARNLASLKQTTKRGER